MKIYKSFNYYSKINTKTNNLPNKPSDNKLYKPSRTNRLVLSRKHLKYMTDHIKNVYDTMKPSEAYANFEKKYMDEILREKYERNFISEKDLEKKIKKMYKNKYNYLRKCCIVN